MDAIPFSAFTLVVVMLLAAWLFLAHMFSSGKDDARLKFLLDLMDVPQADVGASGPATPRPAASMPGANAAKPLQGREDEFAPHGSRSVAGFVSQELPVVFAAALRGRAM